MNPAVCAQRPGELGRVWGSHWFSLQKENIVDDRAYFLSHFMRCAQEAFCSSYFSGRKSEWSVSVLTHCGRPVVFTLDSNTQKDKYRSEHLCIAWSFRAFNVSLIRWEIHVFTQSELRTFSRVFFKPLKGIPICRYQLTALFKGLIDFLFTNQDF